jgi:hypothetical protein
MWPKAALCSLHRVSVVTAKFSIQILAIFVSLRLMLELSTQLRPVCSQSLKLFRKHLKKRFSGEKN